MAAHGAVKLDPAIERFNRMREESYKNFGWTRKTIRTAVLGLIVVPGILYYLSNTGHRKWDWTARRKDEPLDVSA